jgi:hypothetical protein
METMSDHTPVNFGQVTLNSENLPVLIKDIEEISLTQINLADLFAKRKDFNNSFKCYKKFLEIYLDYQRNKNFLNFEADQELVSFENRLNDYKSKIYQACCALGDQFRSKEEFEDAINSYKQALLFNTGDYVTLHKIGLCFKGLNQLTAAVQFFEMAVAYNNSFEDSYNELNEIKEITPNGKTITFFHEGPTEKLIMKPLADEALRRGFAIKFSEKLQEKSEIGIYCSHNSNPENAEFSVIMLHDLGQGCNIWPDFWNYEPWDSFDLGLIPGESWAELYLKKKEENEPRAPRLGIYIVGWPKADIIFKAPEIFQKDVKQIRDKLNLKYEKTVLYAVSWEFNEKQKYFVESLKDSGVNLLIKHADWEEEYSTRINEIRGMEEYYSERYDFVYTLHRKTNIMHAIALADLLVTDESNVLFEALFLNVPTIAVTDWIIIFAQPRLKFAPFEFSINIRQEDLKDTVEEVLKNGFQLNYNGKPAPLSEYGKTWQSQPENSASLCLDIIEEALATKKVTIAENICNRNVENKLSLALYDDPGKYAEKSGLIISGKAYFSGFQKYSLSSKELFISPDDKELLVKKDLLDRIFLNQWLKGKSIMELNASSAFFSFYGLLNGASEVFATDPDNDYIDMVKLAAEKFAYNNLEIIRSDVLSCNQQADLVIAFASVHWLFCQLGSLHAAIRKLASMTNQVLIFEWMEPEDTSKMLDLYEMNQSENRDTYNFQELELCLDKFFDSHNLLGTYTNGYIDSRDNKPKTRSLYIAVQNSEKLREQIGKEHYDLILRNKYYQVTEYITEKNGLKFIRKQAQNDLGYREYNTLKILDSEYFPKVSELQEGKTHLVYKMEFIEGYLLSDIERFIEDETMSGKNTEHIRDFIGHCLNILEILNEKEIVHRDISLENIMVRNNKPVLLNFLWSGATGAEKLFENTALNSLTPEGSYSDVYALGKILKEVCVSTSFPEYLNLVNLMIHPEKDKRITDIGKLRKILEYSEFIGYE